MKKFLREFKEFALRGNVMDLAVGIIIGGAFQGIVKSLVEDVYKRQGLWHGASWNFVLWGLYFFVFLVLEKFFLNKYLEKCKPLAHVYFAVVILLGWVLFYYTDLAGACTAFKGLSLIHI